MPPAPSGSPRAYRPARRSGTRKPAISPGKRTLLGGTRRRGARCWVGKQPVCQASVVRPHPTAPWIRRKLIATTPWGRRRRYLVRDRDRAYGAGRGHRAPVRRRRERVGLLPRLALTLTRCPERPPR